MNTRKLVLFFTALLGLTASAFAQTQQTQATVARVSGSASVTMPDGSSVPLTAGMKVAQGATITTGADGDVYLESHAGYVTSIKHDSVVAVDEISVTTEGGKVKEEKTLLDLKSGNLVAKLDPTKKAVNNYQVRTPKGVAAARGTVFAVQYKGGTYSIAVVNGTVTILPVSGVDAGVAGTSFQGASGADTVGVKVNAGQAYLSAADAGGNATTGANVTKLAAASQNAGAVDIRELLAVAVATVTVAAQNNIGGTTAAEAAQVAQVVFAAVPGAAEQAGAIIKQSNIANPPADPARAATVLQEVTTATPASAQGAFTSGATTGTFTPNTNTTTTNPGSDNSNGADKTTTPQAIDPSTVSRSG